MFYARAGRVLVAAIVLLSCAASKAADPPTCAVIADASLKTLPIAALLQEKLAAAGVRFVEREQVDALLAETRLQAAFAADGGAQRAKLGQLVKADALIMLRLASDRPPVLEVVVCETARGLRLATLSFTPEKRPEIDAGTAAAALEPLVLQAVRKSRDAIREVVAVPPFVCNDLTFRFEHLRSVYARLAEQVLLEQPGVLVVALDEARAIARELAVAGGNVLRPLPVYVFGEFRNDGTGAGQQVSFKLVVKRGETDLAVIDRNAPAAGAPAALREATSQAVVKLLGSAAAPPDAATEARQLGQRAKQLTTLGGSREALPLTESALLLDPESQDLRHDAVAGCGSVGLSDILRGQRDANQFRGGVETYLRGLDHLEYLLRNVATLDHFPRVYQRNFVDVFQMMTFHLFVSPPSKEMPDFVTDGQKQVRDALLRIAPMRLRDRRGDEACYVNWATSSMPEPERYAVVLKLIREWQNEPGNATRIRALVMYGTGVQGMGILGVNTPQGREFLAKLGEVDSTEIREVTQALKAELGVALAKRGDWLRASRERVDRLRAAEKAAASDVPPEIVFNPLDLSAVDAAGTAMPIERLERLIPAGVGIDAAWNYRTVYLMKQRGRLEIAWQADVPNANPSAVAFDGKYLWVAIQRALTWPRLLVIEPRSGEITEITAKDGLPLESMYDPKAPRRGVYMLNVAPLGPGRACIVGSFGRTWMAMVQFDPAKGAAAEKTVKVLHEAREWASAIDQTPVIGTTLAFEPQYLFTLTDPLPARGGGQHQRILIGRTGTAISAAEHPLLLDPETLALTVVADVGCMTRDAVAHRGAIYWVRPLDRRTDDEPGPDLYRMGFPGFARETVGKSIHNVRRADGYDKVFFYRDRVFVAARQWLVADAPDKPFRILPGKYPDWFDSTTYRGEFAKDPREGEKERVRAICPSNHYGLICITNRISGMHLVYDVQFPKLNTP